MFFILLTNIPLFFKIILYYIYYILYIIYYILYIIYYIYYIYYIIYYILYIIYYILFVLYFSLFDIKWSIILFRPHNTTCLAGIVVKASMMCNSEKSCNHISLHAPPNESVTWHHHFHLAPGGKGMAKLPWKLDDPYSIDCFSQKRCPALVVLEAVDVPNHHGLVVSVIRWKVMHKLGNMQKFVIFLVLSLMLFLLYTFIKRDGDWRSSMIPSVYMSRLIPWHTCGACASGIYINPPNRSHLARSQ